MDLKTSAAFAVFFGLVALIHSGEALQCHQCSSFEDAKCADPFWYEPEVEGGERKERTLEFLKDCPNDGNEYTLCRKIYQNVRDDVRVIRSCGWIEHKNECYKTVLEEYNTYVCTCKEDGCNGSTNLKISFLSVLATTLLAAVFK